MFINSSNFMILKNFPTTKRRFYYKILTEPEFNEFYRTSIFHGNRRDLEHGYIHMYKSMEQCSKIRQMYRDIPTIIIILDFKREVNIVDVKAADGNRYPHLYGIIRYGDVNMVQAV